LSSDSQYFFRRCTQRSWQVYATLILLTRPDFQGCFQNASPSDDAYMQQGGSIELRRSWLRPALSDWINQHVRGSVEISTSAGYDASHKLLYRAYFMPVQKATKCPVCHGLGRTPQGKLCKRCKGNGEIIVSVRKGKPHIVIGFLVPRP
jgi:hypothetical protein